MSVSTNSGVLLSTVYELDWQIHCTVPLSHRMDVWFGNGAFAIDDGDVDREAAQAALEAIVDALECES